MLAVERRGRATIAGIVDNSSCPGNFVSFPTPLGVSPPCMNGNRDPQFRRILPVAELLLSAVLLIPWSGLIAWQIPGMLHLRRPTKVEPGVMVLRRSVESEAHDVRCVQAIATLRLSVPALLNLPSGFLGLARRDLVPPGALPQLWRALCWSIVGTFFWWIAGRAVDALRATRKQKLSPKIALAELPVAFFDVGIGVFLCVGFISDPSMRADCIYPWGLTLAASMLWIILGTTTIVARLLQRRLRRATST